MTRISKCLIKISLFIFVSALQAQQPSLNPQKTAFLDFIWEGNSLRLVEITIIPASVKHRRPTELSAQNLYYELTSDGKPLFSGMIKNPKKIHVEYADHNGILHRQEAILETVEFSIRVPAYGTVQSIRFFQVTEQRTGRLRKNVALVLQPDLELIHEIPLDLINGKEKQ